MNHGSPRVTASAVVRTLEGPPKYGGGIIICNTRAQRHEVALALGLEILAIPGAVHLSDQSDDGGHVVTLDVDVLRSFPENTRRIDRSEPAPAPAPSMPSASPPAREPNQERMDEIRQSVDKLDSLSSTHADKEDWATAYYISQASAMLLERIIEELAV